ncbi:MAG: FIST C-terminal domain-containing protein [Bacteroidetes bacterium]|nr:FIST C-terminal domain-containing protein [Bacteroidota bacterium]
MKIVQHIISDSGQSIPKTEHQFDLALVFGSRFLLQDDNLIKKLREAVTPATWLMASTSGEIAGSEVNDDSLVITLIKFEKTEIKSAVINVQSFENSFKAGKSLAEKLTAPELRHLFVLSDGTHVNGSELVRGFNEALPATVTVTGGLAGDAARFEQTVVGLNDNAKPGNIAAIGFYGESIRIGHGSKGGWDSFGPDRKITKARSNILYELDGKSALQLYKEYLGDLAQGLPGTALLFPLALRTEKGSEQLVRTILGVNEADQSMTFAGDMPEGSYARLMRANFDRLIDAASIAANDTFVSLDKNETELAILISCVGRKLVLDQRVDEEVESVRDVLGPEAVFTGFYSYGEISPLSQSMTCELHNQTMTITTFSEA